MVKILDRYVIRTFLGPFLFIFSVLFFIFIVQFAWQELERFTGKGLTFFEIMKLLFYLGITIIQMVLPLTILLASIMTFGQLGETYELTAIKAAGISLLRVMLPLFLLVSAMAVGLFYFSNRVVPSFQYKAKNMLINISKTKPALTFEEGRFINDIPKYSMLINKIGGENSDQFQDILIHSMVPLNDNVQTIIANNGTLQPTKNKYYLKFELYDGYLYENTNKNKNNIELKKQPNQIVKFDTLVRLFDISDLVQSALDQESSGSSYKFLNYRNLSDTVQVMDSVIAEDAKRIERKNLIQTLPHYNQMDSLNQEQEFVPKVDIENLDESELEEIAIRAIQSLDRSHVSIKNDIEALQYRMKVKHKAIFYQQNMLTYSITSILFFLIGSSLGSIIRKGGLGMPVVVAIIVFIVFFILHTIFYQSTKNDLLNPYLGAWLPNIILTPVALFFTIKAVNDSQIFDISRYQEPIQKISRRFVKSKNKEHSRYQ